MRRKVVGCSSILALAWFGMWGCAASLRSEPPSSEIGTLYARDTQIGSPCQDSLYLALRAQPRDSLSERQVRYLLLKEEECASYQKKHQQGSDLVGGLAVGVVIGLVLMAVVLGYALSH
jgi:hypothetical protein